MKVRFKLGFQYEIFCSQFATCLCANCEKVFLWTIFTEHWIFSKSFYYWINLYFSEHKWIIDKIYIFRLYCNIHKRHVHEAIQSFTCEICRVIFPIKSQLLLHTRIHIEELKDLESEPEYDLSSRQKSSSRGNKRSISQLSSSSNQTSINSGQPTSDISLSDRSVGQSNSSSYQPINNSRQPNSSSRQFSDINIQSINSNSGHSIDTNSIQSISNICEFIEGSNSGQSVISNGQSNSSICQFGDSSSQVIRNSGESSWKRNASGEVR